MDEGVAVAPSEDTDGLTVTAVGKVMARLPLDVRFSRMLVLSIALGSVAEAVVLAATLSAGHGGTCGDMLAPTGGSSAGAGEEPPDPRKSFKAPGAAAAEVACRHKWDRKVR